MTLTHRTSKWAAAAIGAAAFLAAGVVTAAMAERPHISVYFVQGEQLVPVQRAGRTARAAVQQLLAGPTRAEWTRGFRSYVPPRTHIRSVRVADGIARVDLTGQFVAGPTSADPGMLARLAELVHTLTGVEGTTKVQLLVNGASTAGMFPGVSTGSPVSLRFLERPNVPVAPASREKLPPPEPGVRAMQRQLIVLGYLLPGADDGRFGPVTQNAVLAFQKWERLARTGLVDTRTRSRLTAATRPSPRTHGGAGKRAEILLDRQVTLLIRDDRVVRTIAVSTGKASTPTPTGSYHVYAKITRWWSVPFREWLPYALPFVGGIAFHELADVPAYPASHGCVRQSSVVASWTYRFAYVGMPVRVLARS